jgi:hypothetical protein
MRKDQMKIRNLACAVPLFAIALIPSTVRAASITETFSLPAVSGYVNENGTSFAGFNTALGTLNSVTFELNATATFSGGGSSDLNEANYEFDFTGNTFYPESFNAQQTGNGAAVGTLTLTTNNPITLSDFAGAPRVDVVVTISDLGSTPNVIASNFSTETVIYNYTPAVTPASEPATAALVGGGFLACGLWRRRRLLPGIRLA